MVLQLNYGIAKGVECSKVNCHCISPRPLALNKGVIGQHVEASKNSKLLNRLADHHNSFALFKLG